MKFGGCVDLTTKKSIHIDWLTPPRQLP